MRVSLYEAGFIERTLKQVWNAQFQCPLAQMIHIKPFTLLFQHTRYISPLLFGSFIGHPEP